jgi:hypothetical protein
MADLALPEFASRIALLPPISRGAHLAGPRLHAQRLVTLWTVADDNDVSLTQAFRLLDVNAVEGAIWRTAAAREHAGDPHCWTFPAIEELLPELRELSWHDMLAGTILTEAIKGLRGTQHRAVLPAELQRLTPDWQLSRLTGGSHDEFIDVRVRRPPSALIKTSWRDRKSKTKLKAAMQDIAHTYPPGAQPAFSEIMAALRARMPDLPRDAARAALKDYAPQLQGHRGRRSTRLRS